MDSVLHSGAEECEHHDANKLHPQADDELLAGDGNIVVHQRLWIIEQQRLSAIQALLLQQLPVRRAALAIPAAPDHAASWL